MNMATIGLDIAKSVFQVHGVNAGEAVIVRRIKRRELLRYFEKLPPALIGIEACATAHHWARQLTAIGHDVRLLPPAYVKPYVKRQKNDAADAEAICEAVSRPTMRFVPVKSEEQQSAGTLHRARTLLVKQRTMLLNAIRAHLAEFGIPTGVGPAQVIRIVGELDRGERFTHKERCPAPCILPLVSATAFLGERPRSGYEPRPRGDRPFCLRVDRQPQAHLA